MRGHSVFAVTCRPWRAAQFSDVAHAGAWIRRIKRAWRAELADTVGRQGNLLVSSDRTVSREKLRKMLIDE